MKKLNRLLTELEHEIVQGSTDTDITALVYDNRKVEDGCIFVCIEGMNFDGHTVAAKAAEDGAVAIVVSKDVEGVPESVTVIKTKDTRYALAMLSAAWFDHPAKKLITIGVTGTKGKTTTTYLIRSILERTGKKTGLVGTIETIIGDKHIPSKNTTPESYILQQTFREMVDAGIEAVVMEASSQGFKLHRTAGFVFDYGIFTNLESDHIGPGEHEDFEDYLRCKAMLFKQCRVGIVNGDDEHTKAVVEGHTCELMTYGIDNECDLRASDLSLVNGGDYLGVDFKLSGVMDFSARIKMPGRFSVYNALCAIAVCHYFDVLVSDIKAALESAQVKGRIEFIDLKKKVADAKASGACDGNINTDFSLMIDYAHNAMALESLLKTLKEYSPARLVSLFGCGGNRSKLRRYEMGEVSGKLADLTVITSDNPRFEEPQDIINDIKTGISKTDGEYVEICDRYEAIKYVIENAKKGDVVVLAGKGHEDYQEIKGEKHHMDERELIDRAVKSLLPLGEGGREAAG